MSLVVRKAMIIPSKFIKQVKHLRKDTSGRLQLCYVLSKQRQPPHEEESTLFPGSRSWLYELYGLDAALDITHTFREDNFDAWKERLIESGDAGLTGTEYHHLELEELKDNYYFLQAEKVLYDSGAIGADDDYENTPFYKFFIRQLKLSVRQDTLPRPVSFAIGFRKGELIVLNAMYGGF